MIPVRPRIAILGAAGLIGSALVERLTAEGLAVIPVARRFTPAQAARFPDAVISPLVDLSVEELALLLKRCSADLVVNCIGILQDDGQHGSTADVHGGFVSRLLAAMQGDGARETLLVHLSVPGREAEDATGFSTSKRDAERIIRASGLPFAILRPGFVIAPNAYGGSALLRSLAALPFALPASVTSRPFAATDIGDIARTVVVLADRWSAGERTWSITWDVMERDASPVGAVIEAFRRHLGGPQPRLALPSPLLALGARLGDLAAWLGWSPPIRSTALAEMRRGVEGDPAHWMTVTGISPASLRDTLLSIPSTIQEQWFARLYLLKPLVFGILVIFWAASGLIAIGPSFAAASGILEAYGVPPGLAAAGTVMSSLADIGIGIAIAFRRTTRPGLLAGIALSLFYMIAAAVLTPALWIEPLGALVKTFPAIVLMLVALAILPSR